MEEYQQSMKTILIIGDSWGVPNYTTSLYDLKFVEKTGDTHDTHTEYLLRNKGYKVHNCSINGASNSATINLARKYLNGEKVILEPRNLNFNLHPTNIKTANSKTTYVTSIEKGCKIDVFIWFHTEFCRDPYFDKAKNINDNIKYSAEKTYSLAADFFKEYPQAKIVVIGGQAPVATEILHQYLMPDYLIQDWRSEIIGIKLPVVHTLSNLKLVDKSIDTTEFKLDLLEKHEVIMDAMRNSPDFPDNKHPGASAHEKLAERLHEFIKETFSEND